VKRYTNRVLDRSGAPTVMWLFALLLVIFCLNNIVDSNLACGTQSPIDFSTRNLNDISPLLQFSFWEPVYYLSDGSRRTAILSSLTGQVFLGIRLFLEKFAPILLKVRPVWETRCRTRVLHGEHLGANPGESRRIRAGFCGEFSIWGESYGGPRRIHGESGRVWASLRRSTAGSTASFYTGREINSPEK